jgi:CheY-like chemotaxis protein
MTVIVIDDDPGARAVNGRALAKAGFSVHSGGSARAVIDLSRNLHDLVLILLDIHLPGADGFDALRLLKSHPLLRNVPVLMISAAASPEKADEAQRLGAVGLLSYPLSDQELVAAVREAIDPKPNALAS